MPQFSKYLPEYLSFTRKERTGIISIFVLILFFSILPFFFPFFISSKPVDHRAFEKEIAALKIKEPDSARSFEKKNYSDDDHYYPSPEKNYRETKGELFYFDPNDLTAEGWKKLGIRDKTIITIQKYIAKGGKFYKPEDISRIWGLHKDEVERLLPYVRIKQLRAGNFPAQKNDAFKSYEKPIYDKTVIDLNSTDTSALIALPGIGGKLANRIISFRDKLGGFYKIDQVGETFGLPDSVFQKIKGRLAITNTAVKKLDINNATFDELRSHPYIRYNIANAIIQYRVQHGAFSTVADIKKIMMITEDIYNKLAPYLLVQ